MCTVWLGTVHCTQVQQMKASMVCLVLGLMLGLMLSGNVYIVGKFVVDACVSNNNTYVIDYDTNY